VLQVLICCFTGEQLGSEILYLVLQTRRFGGIPTFQEDTASQNQVPSVTTASVFHNTL